MIEQEINHNLGEGVYIDPADPNYVVFTPQWNIVHINVPDDIIDNIRKNRPITDSERRYWSTIERAAEIFGDPLLHYDEACFVAPGKRSAIITETQNAETLIDWLSSRGIFIISNNRFYSSIPPPQRRMLLREIFTIN